MEKWTKRFKKITEEKWTVTLFHQILSIKFWSFKLADRLFYYSRSHRANADMASKSLSNLKPKPSLLLSMVIPKFDAKTHPFLQILNAPAQIWLPSTLLGENRYPNNDVSFESTFFEFGDMLYSRSVIARWACGLCKWNQLDIQFLSDSDHFQKIGIHSRDDARTFSGQIPHFELIDGDTGELKFCPVIG